MVDTTPINDPRFNKNEVPVVTPWKKYSKFNKYEEQFPRKVYDLATDGKTDAQIAKALGCGKPTLMRWIEEDPDMREAYELGATNREAHFDTMIEENMIAPDAITPLKQRDDNMIKMHARANFTKFDEKKADVKADENTEMKAMETLKDIIGQMERIKTIAEQPPVVSFEMKDITPNE